MSARRRWRPRDRTGGRAARWVPLILVALGGWACAGSPAPTGDGSREARERSALDPSAWLLTVLADQGGHNRLDVDVETLERHYRASGYAPLWIDADGLTSEGRQAVEDIERVAIENGLEPDRYRVPELQSRSSSPDLGGHGRELAELEVLVSGAALDLGRHLANGSVPSDAVWDRPVETDPTPDASLLAAMERTGSVQEALADVLPSLDQYRRMAEALARYRAIAAGGGWTPVPASDGRAIESGDSVASVASLRTRLLESDDPVERELAQRGEASADVLDADLAQALRRFQIRHALEPDGVRGPNTLRELNRPVDERIEALELGLERLRHLPRLDGTAILVNVAGYTLHVLEDGHPALTAAVAVGQRDWRTMLFADTLSHLVVNPYWHVPASIAEAEVFPAVRADSAYLARNGYEVVDIASGSVLDPAEVDWSEAGSDAVRFRQKPGPANALGGVKFMLPNEYDIYLHDTPARSVFGEPVRAFSHGCIRVEHPERLAQYLLEHHSEHEADAYETAARTGEQTELPLSRGVPVYLTYLTAWVDPDGAVRFFPDIYGRDRAVVTALGVAPPR